MYEDEQEDMYSREEYKTSCELVRKQDATKNVAKAVITVACIGLICAIIDCYVDGR